MSTTKATVAVCGAGGSHWFKEGATCQCGQIPHDIFFAENCDCGAPRHTVGHRAKPVHLPTCAWVKWGQKRNAFITDHKLDPPLEYSTPSVSDEPWWMRS